MLKVKVMIVFNDSLKKYRLCLVKVSKNNNNQSKLSKPLSLRVNMFMSSFRG